MEKGTSVGPTENYGWTPLHIASLNGHLEVVLYLLKKEQVLKQQRINALHRFLLQYIMSILK
jgi:ankyrin repeat protein